MLGSLVRAVVLIVVIVGAGALLMGWWGGDRFREDVRQTVGTGGVDTQKAREVGAKIGEQTAAAAGQARDAINEGALTAKIKAKMALDDTVKALDIDVDTAGTTVTLSGIVATEAQRKKALELARDTEGVKRVVDQLQVRR
jgi:hyperosmotically inducible protein